MNCPNCEKPFNHRRSVIPFETHGPGDLAVCYHCASILVVKADLSLARMSDELVRRVQQTNPRIWKQVKRITAKIRERLSINPN